MNKLFLVRRYLLPLLIVILSGTPALTSDVSDFTAAKRAAAQSGQKILLEFYRESCEFCHKADEEFSKNPQVRAALDNVVHLKLNAREGEGYELAPKYKIGYSFPVFILCDSAGDVFFRWVGFTHTENFLQQLKIGHSQNLTISQRVTVQQNKPTYENALFLARYFEESLEYLKATEYYRQAEKLSDRIARNYSYQIFENLANASWNDQIEFERVLPAADTLVKLARPFDMVRMATSITNLARKVGKLDQIKGYLEAGIHTAKTNRDSEQIARYYPSLLADYALHFSHDTAAAMKIKLSSYGDNWQNDPISCYQFARWCLDRRINLEQAEQLARFSVSGIKEGYYRGQVYSMIAEICYNRGKIGEAREMLQAAIQQDPENDYYWDMLEQYQTERQ